jgi:hypothetical protein
LDHGCREGILSILDFQFYKEAIDIILFKIGNMVITASS